MALGFFLGVCAAFLWSIVNLIDKYLVERFSKDTGLGALIILSSLFPIVLLPITYFLAGGDISIDTYSLLLLLFTGVLTTTWITLYLFALEGDDTSIVVPLIFQLTPLFALPIAFIMLKELPAATQLIAGAIIIIGALVLAFERTTGKLKMRLLFLITGSAIAVALMNTLFKFVALDATFWISMFWHSLGIVLSGLSLLAFHGTYRKQFFNFIKQNAGPGLSLNAISESITLWGDIMFAYALLLAPVALIQTTESFQPVFVFFIGLAATLIAPKLLQEDFSRAAVIQKVIGIGLVVAGSIYLYAQ